MGPFYGPIVLRRELRYHPVGYDLYFLLGSRAGRLSQGPGGKQVSNYPDLDTAPGAPEGESCAVYPQKM